MGTITIRELSKKINISTNCLRTHLCNFEAYRIKSKKSTFLYNLEFMKVLRDYFEARAERGTSQKKRFAIAQKIKEIIEKWENE